MKDANGKIVPSTPSNVRAFVAHVERQTDAVDAKPPRTTVTFYRHPSGDWERVMINGTLAFEGHCLEAVDLARRLHLTVIVEEKDDAFFRS
jgi:hypothetical protein